MKHALALVLALLCGASLQAQPLQLAGILGSKALLVSGGGAPKAVAVGESFEGSRVVAVTKDEITLETDGQRETLRVGAAPVSVGPRSAAPARLVLYADQRGHFMSDGQINGRPMQFMVDTGATTIALGRPQAERLALKVGDGKPVRMQTANGVTQGWRVKLQSVRLGALEQQNVDAIITEESMPYVLLGNTFLKPYEMTRKGDELVLEGR